MFEESMDCLSYVLTIVKLRHRHLSHFITLMINRCYQEGSEILMLCHLGASFQREENDNNFYSYSCIYGSIIVPPLLAMLHFLICIGEQSFILRIYCTH